MLGAGDGDGDGDGVVYSLLWQGVRSRLAKHAQPLLEMFTFNRQAHMCWDLAALDSDSALRRRLKHYAAPDLLLADEVGYLSYSNRHADLQFELNSRRYEQKSTSSETNAGPIWLCLPPLQLSTFAIVAACKHEVTVNASATHKRRQ